MDTLKYSVNVVSLVMEDNNAYFFLRVIPINFDYLFELCEIANIWSYLTYKNDYFIWSNLTFVLIGIFKKPLKI